MGHCPSNGSAQARAQARVSLSPALVLRRGRKDTPGKRPLKIADDLSICLAWAHTPECFKGLAGGVEQ